MGDKAHAFTLELWLHIIYKRSCESTGPNVQKLEIINYIQNVWWPFKACFIVKIDSFVYNIYYYCTSEKKKHIMYINYSVT